MVKLSDKHRSVQPARRKTRSGSARSGVHQFRPYCPPMLIPVCAALCESAYGYEVRHQILDRLKQGLSLRTLVGFGLVEREDLDELQRCLDRGRVESARLARRKIADRTTTAGEWTRCERREERREKLRMKRDYPLRMVTLDTPYLDPDADADEWIDPTADEYGDPVYYDDGRPSSLPDREPFDPGMDTDGPSDAEWDEMYERSRLDRIDWTPSGGID